MAKILVVREKDAFSEILIERGFSVINFPFIKTEEVADLSELENHLENLDCFDGIFITSAHAAKVFIDKASAKNKSFGGKFYVFGNRSVNLLGNAGYTTFSSREAETAAQFLESVSACELENKKFLFLRGNRSLRVVPDALKNVAEVTETVVYRTDAIEPNEDDLIEIKEKITRGEISVICFFSPSGAEEFTKKFADFSLSEIKIAAIGETTARFIKASNMRVDFISKSPSARDFALGLIDFLKAETRA